MYVLLEHGIGFFTLFHPTHYSSCCIQRFLIWDQKTLDSRFLKTDLDLHVAHVIDVRWEIIFIYYYESSSSSSSDEDVSMLLFSSSSSSSEVKTLPFLLLSLLLFSSSSSSPSPSSLDRLPPTESAGFSSSSSSSSWRGASWPSIPSPEWCYRSEPVPEVNVSCIFSPLLRQSLALCLTRAPPTPSIVSRRTLRRMFQITSLVTSLYQNFDHVT